MAVEQIEAAPTVTKQACLEAIECDFKSGDVKTRRGSARLGRASVSRFVEIIKGAVKLSSRRAK